MNQKEILVYALIGATRSYEDSTSPINQERHYAALRDLKELLDEEAFAG